MQKTNTQKTNTQKSNTQKTMLLSEGETILLALKAVQNEIICAQTGFALATDEALIDSYIYQIRALHKKYEYFLKQAKELGLTSFNTKIS